MWLAILTGAILPGLAGPALPSPPPAATPAVFVDEVIPSGAAGRAGLREGDGLTEARLPDGHRVTLATSFDVRAVEIEAGMAGPVVVSLVRDGEVIEAALPAGRWELRTRPFLDGRERDDWMRGKARLFAGEAAAALKLWRRAAHGAAGRGPAAVASFWLCAAEACTKRRAAAEAHVAYAQARTVAESNRAPLFAGLVWAAEARSFVLEHQLAQAQDAGEAAVRAIDEARPESLLFADVLADLARILTTRGDLEAAGRAYARALAAAKTESLVVAAVHYDLGVQAWERRDLESAEGHHRQAYGIRERLAPESLELAASASALGNLALYRGDAATGGPLCERAYALREKLGADRLTLAESWTSLGIVAWTRGDLAQAQQSFAKAQAVYEAERPGSLVLADTLNNLGAVLETRGDVDAAERAYFRALEIDERRPDGAAATAKVLQNLGDVAVRRRDLARAEDLYHRSLEATRRPGGPPTMETASLLDRMATVLAEEGKREPAAQASAEAIGILRAVAPDGPALASALVARGRMLEGFGDFTGAEALYRESTRGRGAADGDFADGLIAMAGLAARRGENERAAAQLGEALRTVSRLLPGTEQEARVAYELGAVRRRQGRLKEAADLFRQARTAIEAQAGRLGGADDVRSDFAAGFKDFYRDSVEVLLELHREDEAFDVLERYRARGFLALLADRDLTFPGDLPEELVREWKEVDVRFSRLQAEIGQLSLGATSDRAARLAELRDLRDQKDAIKRRIREAAPRVAALRDPQPLTTAEVARRLEPGTVLLSFLVGRAQTFLFVVSPGTASPLFVRRIPVGESELRERVRLLTGMISSEARVPEIAAVSHALYRDLLEPVEPRLSAAERLLVVADGPLLRVPFAALVRRENGLTPEYLVAWRPLYSALSATVDAELRRSRAKGASGRLVAFGDPVNALPRLPFARREVEAVAARFPDDAAVFLGARATESEAKAQMRAARYVHFACHGLLDEQVPLNSALMLTRSDGSEDGDDGLLQAWEVLEKVRLDADLVTLSACGSGLGKEAGGEGLVGLTRAFQFAGARSVLASLWSVSDESTAELMSRFYAHLRSGESKAEALRAAQLELVGSAHEVPEGTARDIGGVRARGALQPLSHPFRWAAFQLVGDWR